jgi:hypothetical protein
MTQEVPPTMTNVRVPFVLESDIGTSTTTPLILASHIASLTKSNWYELTDPVVDLLVECAGTVAKLHVDASALPDTDLIARSAHEAAHTVDPNDLIEVLRDLDRGGRKVSCTVDGVHQALVDVLEAELKAMFGRTVKRKPSRYDSYPAVK